MLFNSLQFLLFFGWVFCLYYLVPHKVRWVLLLLCSIYFYMCWNINYVFIILGIALIDYGCGIVVSKISGQRNKKIFLITSLCSNLLILFFFKYYHFFQWHLNEAMSSSFLPVLDFILPMGISFHTFQSMGYTIDVYRGKIPAEKNPLRFILYVMFFPQMVAGPIERGDNLIPELKKKVFWNTSEIANGAHLALWGVFKKVVLADRLTMMVDPVYHAPQNFSSAQLLFATYAFALQIYFDFSGYTDIAIGIARMLGIKLNLNFNSPYKADSLQNFWQRWHISLSSWFRDYVYFPLGGNKKSANRNNLNLLITFLLSGFWHGANFTFIIWGAWHGIGLITEKYLKKIFSFTLPRMTKRIFVFHFVLVGWIWFRAQSMHDAVSVFKRIFSFDFSSGTISEMYWTEIVFAFAISSLVLLLEFKNIKPEIISSRKGKWIYSSAMLAGIYLFGVFHLKQFLYFQF
ncbi:MAG TPA: membrane-bound O-acyltransferase family protein [Bacteroidetes bacterium]|nr:membrane-bound O-acyltransferase family protein [Bacteroidota bacterium]